MSVYRTIGPLVVILPDAGAISTSVAFLFHKTNLSYKRLNALNLLEKYRKTLFVKDMMP